MGSSTPIFEKGEEKAKELMEDGTIVGGTYVWSPGAVPA
jgi:hypothetical protein